MFSQRAFSLVEILTVLSLITILAMIAVPSLRNFLIDTQSNILRSQFIQAIQLGQQEARIRQVPVAICKSVNNKTCSTSTFDRLLIFINEKKDGIVRDDENILAIMQTHRQDGQFNWRTFPFYRNYLLFFPRASDNGTFWYCESAQEKPAWALMLNKMGRVRMLIPNRNGIIKDNLGKILDCNKYKSSHFP